MHHEKQLALHWTVLKNSHVIKFLLAVFFLQGFTFFRNYEYELSALLCDHAKKNNFFITHLAQHNLQYSTVILYIYTAPSAGSEKVWIFPSSVKLLLSG